MNPCSDQTCRLCSFFFNCFLLPLPSRIACDCVRWSTRKNRSSVGEAVNDFSRSHIAQKYCEICKPKSDDVEAVDDSESVASSYNDGALAETQDEINGLKCLVVSKDETICELEKYVIQLKLIIAEKLIEACKSGIITTIAVAPGCPSPGKSITTQSPISYANSVTRRLTSPTEVKESSEHSIILKPTIPMTNHSKLNLKDINYKKRHIEKSIWPTH